MRAITPIIFSSLLALAIVHNALAQASENEYMDAGTSVSKNPFGLVRRPREFLQGTKCSQNTNQGSCEGSCEWRNGHCGCKYAVTLRRCLNGKVTDLYYPKTTNVTLASTERANNKTWTHSRTSELNLWANCVKLSKSYDMLPIQINDLYLKTDETSTNRHYYKTLDCTGIDDYEKPKGRWYSDSACANLLGTIVQGTEDDYNCPKKRHKDPKAMCSVNSACGTLSSTLTPGCETEDGCISSTLSASFEFDNFGTEETCTWANSKCGCSSGAYRQVLCYNNTLFDVVWNTAEGCLNGTDAGQDLSNVIYSRKVTDEDMTKCEGGGGMVNGTSYSSTRRGFCQGRPDFSSPATMFYSNSGCTGTSVATNGMASTQQDVGQCFCAVSRKKECVPSTFACDGNGGLITKTYATPKFSSSSICSGTPQSTITTNTKVAIDFGNEYPFTLDTCELDPKGQIAVQFTCIGVPAGNSPKGYAIEDVTSCPSGGVNASNAVITDIGNSSSLSCVCLPSLASSTSPSPASSTSPSPSNSTSPSPAAAENMLDSSMATVSPSPHGMVLVVAYSVYFMAQR